MLCASRSPLGQSEERAVQGEDGGQTRTADGNGGCRAWQAQETHLARRWRLMPFVSIVSPATVMCLRAFVVARAPLAALPRHRWQVVVRHESPLVSPASTAAGRLLSAATVPVIARALVVVMLLRLGVRSMVAHRLRWMTVGLP
jgi:hypothetical protein